MYLAVDANFKLKGKSRGISDVELMPGWALFVEEEQYQRYLADYVDQPEASISSVECRFTVADDVTPIDQHLRVGT